MRNDIIFEQQDLRYLSWTRTRKSSGTAGSFLKSYDDSGEKKLYYKLSDYDPQTGVVGHECVNEIIAGRLMELLGIPHLEYSLLNAIILIDGKEESTFLCRSADFKEKTQKKITLEEFYASECVGRETPFDFCIRMGWENMIFGMLVTDYLIINRDRHGANIEILIDRKEKSIRPAPLFDQGLSLLCRCRTPEEIAAFDPLGDPAVQSFIGGRSTAENLKLVPREFLRGLPAIGRKDISVMLTGIDRVLSPGHSEKIREILTRRWEIIDGIRNS